MQRLDHQKKMHIAIYIAIYIYRQVFSRKSPLEVGASLSGSYNQLNHL